MYFHNRVLTYFLCVPSVFLYFSSITHLNGKLFISCMLYLLYPSVIVFIIFIVKGAVCRILTLLKHKNTIICLQTFRKHVKLTYLFN